MKTALRPRLVASVLLTLTLAGTAVLARVSVRVEYRQDL